MLCLTTIKESRPSTLLKHFVFLTSCSLSGNEITDKGAYAIATTLQVNKSLQSLK